MKKFAAIILSALMITSLAACSGEDKSIDQVIDKKAIVMGYDKTNIPLGFMNESGTYTGFDLDLAKAICKKITTPSGTQVTLNIMPLSGQEAVDSVLNGAVDFLGNSMSVHGEGSDNLSYSYSLFENNQVIAVSKESTVENKIALEGKKFAVVSNSPAAEALEGDSSFKSKVTVSEVSDINTAVSRLESGEVDALIMDEVCAKYLITKGMQLRVLDEALKTDGYQLVFNKDSKSLMKKINSILKELEEDGTLEELSVKWFGENIIKIK